MTEDKKPFLPLEAVKKLAALRFLQEQLTENVANSQIALEATEAYKVLEEAERGLIVLKHDLVKAEALFKAGCEDIFEETDEKKFPGGQIKMRSTIGYDEAIAIDWAIEHEHVELLSLVKGKFKKMCSGITPFLEGKAFVKKEKIGKMHIDSDLSQYLEDGD